MALDETTSPHTDPSKVASLQAFSTLARTSEQVFGASALEDRLAEGRPLRIKYGVDVTAPFLHIGHAVNLWAMRELQDAGHKVDFLIGNFTTRIGDPTGKSRTRPHISEQQIEKDAADFIAQVQTILRSDPELFEVRRNTEWWDPMGLDRFMQLLAMVTHSKLVQRDMFQARMGAGTDIYMHEMLYPVLQGYDSYALESDLTIVGTDQLFNELMGRFFQERLDQPPQAVITTTITPGTDGREKQSKSLGNYIALADSPRDKFGKAMSLPDELVTEYLRVYTLVPLEEIRQLEDLLQKRRVNPRDAKRKLAKALVERYHGENVAEQEDQWFMEVFSDRSTPTDAPEVVIPGDDLPLIDVLKACLPDSSTSALRRLLREGAVRVEGSKVTDPEQTHAVASGDIVRVGKRQWFRIVFEGES